MGSPLEIFGKEPGPLEGALNRGAERDMNIRKDPINQNLCNTPCVVE